MIQVSVALTLLGSVVVLEYLQLHAAQPGDATRNRVINAKAIAVPEVITGDDKMTHVSDDFSPDSKH